MRAQQKGPDPRRFVLVGTFVFAIFIAFLVWREHKTNLRPEAASHGGSTPAPGLSTPLPQTSPAAAPEISESLKGALDDRDRESIRACLKDIEVPFEIEKLQKVNELSQLIPPPETAPRHLQLHNLHIVRADGSRWRLQLLPADGQGLPSSQLQVRLFSVDNENLPVPEELEALWPKNGAAAKNLEDKKAEDYLREFRNMGRVGFEEISEDVRFSLGSSQNSSAQLIYQNGQLVSLQLFLKAAQGTSGSLRALMCEPTQGASQSGATTCRCIGASN